QLLLPDGAFQLGDPLLRHSRMRSALRLLGQYLPQPWSTHPTKRIRPAYLVAAAPLIQSLRTNAELRRQRRHATCPVHPSNRPEFELNRPVLLASSHTRSPLDQCASFPCLSSGGHSTRASPRWRAWSA